MQNFSTMANEISSREIPKIEISYDTRKDLQELPNNYKFVKYILENTLSSIESGIKNKSDKIELYDVINLSLIIELKRENFTKVLTTISDFYQEKEDYEMCARIQKLKKKI